MIKSKFYLIRGDGKPIYVGFTNRTIKQRFSEHKYDKDFSDYSSVTIEKLDELSYDFTWDEDTLYKNANEVSIREAQLILEYGTQDSKYQVAIDGGKVWTYEKYFVRKNKDNPKFVGMTSDEINMKLNIDDNNYLYLKNFINQQYNDGSANELFLTDFIHHQVSYDESFLFYFIIRQESKSELFLKRFIQDQNSCNEIFLKGFIKDQINKNEFYLKDF